VRRTGPPLAVVAVLLALSPATALAAHHHHAPKPPPAVQQVLNDCGNHNHLQHRYPLAVLQQALRDIPTDAREYSICSVEIEHAINALIGGTRSAPSASAAVKSHVAQTAPTELAQAQGAGQQAVTLAGAKVTAGAVQINGGSLLGTLPTPVLIVLIALLALAAVPVVVRLRSIVRARRTH